MNKIVKYITIIIFCTAGAVYGQTPPVSVKVDGVTYFQHGFNSEGGPPPQTREIRDSVTVSSTVKYVVLPNRTLNPQFDLADLDESNEPYEPWKNVRSTFNWSLSSSPASHETLLPAPGTQANKPMIAIQWNTAGDYTLNVVEVPDDDNTCDVLPTSIPVVVIPKPTMAFVPKNGEYFDFFCFAHDATTIEAIDWDFDVTATTQSSDIRIKYTVSRDGVQIGVETETRIGANRKFTVELDGLGEYEITITSVTDRIAVKSGVTGDVIEAGEKFTVRIFKNIQTSPIYRVPNDF